MALFTVLAWNVDYMVPIGSLLQLSSIAVLALVLSLSQALGGRSAGIGDCNAARIRVESLSTSIMEDISDLRAPLEQRLAIWRRHERRMSLIWWPVAIIAGIGLLLTSIGGLAVLLIALSEEDLPPLSRLIGCGVGAAFLAFALIVFKVTFRG